MTHRTRWTAAAVLMAAAWAAPGAGQEPDVRDRYRLPPLPVQEVAARGAWAAPGLTLGVPGGFGADWADAFVGAGVQHRTRLEDRPDGGLVAGFGVGSARRAVGLEVAVSQFGTARSCCRGGVSLKVHRLLPSAASVAVGVENLATWGRMAGSRDATDAGTSVYAAATTLVRLRRDPGAALGSGSVTVGVGNGRFRTEDQVLDGRETVNVFGGVSLRLARPASLLVDWTGQDLVAGASLLPFRGVPVVVTPGVADLTTEPRLILGVGWGFSYRPHRR